MAAGFAESSSSASSAAVQKVTPWLRSRPSRGLPWLHVVTSSEKAKSWDLPDLTRMMLATRCRIGECLAIGWSEVDLDVATVDVCWRLVRRTGVGLLRLSSTKSGRKGERMIPLPSRAVTMLTSSARDRSECGTGLSGLAGRLAGSVQRAQGVAAGPSRGRDRRLREPYAAQDRRELRRRRRGVHPADQRPTRALRGQHDAGPLSRPQVDDRRTADALENLLGSDGLDDEKGSKDVPGS